MKEFSYKLQSNDFADFGKGFAKDMKDASKKVMEIAIEKGFKTLKINIKWKKK